ncbi:TatD family hydrolase [Myroides injenensis]|uniref:TatD family hydrolase n=1 Tax=Myroides injenensis TaxID=1183151 RepID=UPI00028967B8|nr:TatD family hydrolase [Myroides injenensis]
MKIDIHTHHIDKKVNDIAIINQYPLEANNTLPYFSVGIHPWYINEKRIEEELSFMEKHLKLNNCLAIGECGLDKKTQTPLDIQIKVFTEQLLLAEKYKKAVILHVVSAYQEIIAIKKELKLSIPLIVHGFNKNMQVAESLLKNGFYLSFGKALITYSKLSEVFISIPSDRIFLETDNSLDITIDEVYQKALTLRPDIEQQIEKNFSSVFTNNYNSIS